MYPAESLHHDASLMQTKTLNTNRPDLSIGSATQTKAKWTWAALAMSLLFCFTPSSQASWEYSKKLGLGYEHFHRLSPVADKSGGVVSAELGVQWVKGNWRLSERGYGIARSGVQDKSRIANGDFQELFVENVQRSWIFQVGLNSVNWGTTDFNNPLDVVNSRILESVVSPIKRGAPMIKIEKTFNSWAIEALWIPHQVPTLLPPESSRWLPRDSLPGRYVGSIDSDLGRIKGYLSLDPITYKVKSPTFLNNPQKNNAGARITGRLGETDVQLIYHEGMATTPSVNVSAIDYKAVDVDPQPPNAIIYAIGPTILLFPEFAKYRTAGISTASSFGSWILKMAHAKSQAMTDQIALQDSWSYAASLENSRSFWSLDWNFLIQNYQIYQRSLPSTSALETASFFSINEAMNQSWLLGVRAASGLSWSLMAGAQLAPFSKGGVGRLSFEKRVSEMAHWYLTSEWIDGETGSSLHQLRSASRLQSGFNLSW